MKSIAIPSKVVALVATFCVTACQEPSQRIADPKPLGDQFQIAATDYSTQYFFVDTSYLPFYEDFFLNEPPMVHPSKQLVSAEVWIESRSAAIDPNTRQAMALIDLGARNAGYPDSLRSGGQYPGQIESGRFTRLASPQFEIWQGGYLGIIRFNEPVDDAATIAISYLTADGNQYGEFLSADTSYDTWPLLLKLLKPRNLLTSGYPYAWRLIVKSIYPIGYAGLIRTKFFLNVCRQENEAARLSSLLGTRLLTILGLDYYSADGTPIIGGDGIFDYRPGRTIDQNHGDIIFPYLRPFDEGIQHYFERIGRPRAEYERYLLPLLYDSSFAVQGRQPFPSYCLVGSTLHQ